jgi:hypothetical protein
MIVSNLEEAQEIVENTKTLGWEGWDIVQLIEDDYAEYLPNGVYNKDTNKWYRRISYELTPDGWIIPDKVIRG